MKKLTVALIACFSMVAGVFAAEQESAQQAPEAADTFQRTETRKIEPVPFAIGGEETIDVIGLRLSAWNTCHDLTGVDLAIGGEAQNAYGLQLALLRNKVRDRAGALQIALLGVNEAFHLDGVQLALLWNDTSVMRSAQIGLLNTSHDMRGLQIGLINTTNTSYGYQIGLINVIKGSTVPFFPIINFQLED